MLAFLIIYVLVTLDEVSILDNPGQYKSHQPRPITVTETLVIAHFTKTKSKNCLIINCFEENNLKHTSK